MPAGVKLSGLYITGSFYFVCHAILFVILLFLKKIASDNKVACNVGFYVSLEMTTSGRVLSHV